jgi:hypothetical protein
MKGLLAALAAVALLARCARSFFAVVEGWAAAPSASAERCSGFFRQRLPAAA